MITIYLYWSLLISIDRMIHQVYFDRIQWEIKFSYKTFTQIPTSLMSAFRFLPAIFPEDLFRDGVAEPFTLSVSDEFFAWLLEFCDFPGLIWDDWLLFAGAFFLSSALGGWSFERFSRSIPTHSSSRLLSTKTQY